MSKRRKKFKDETKRRGFFDSKVLESMDDFFKEQSEKYRQRKKR